MNEHAIQSAAVQSAEAPRDGSFTAGMSATDLEIRKNQAALILAGLAAFGVGLRISLPASLTPALVIAVALAPVWLSALRHYYWARTILCLTAVAAGNGFALMMLASTTAVIDHGETVALLFLLVGIFAGAGVLLWARLIVGTVPVVVLFSLATILTVSRSNAGVISNPWKFGYSIPITLLVLALAWSTRKLWVELAALALLAIVGMLNDSRSYFAMLLVAAVVIVWQRVAHSVSRRNLAFSTVGLLGGAFLIYFLSSRLAVAGVLGEEAAARTQLQMTRSGGLLLGGRPELAATLELMRERPLGFGLGRMPSSVDVAVAKTGMFRAGYDPNNGYVERYMFGGGFEVHSLFGDFWIHLGIPGLLLIAFVGLICLTSLAFNIRDSKASALEVFLLVLLLWNIAFSPLYSSIPATTLAIAVLLWNRVERSESASRGKSGRGVIGRTPI